MMLSAVLTLSFAYAHAEPPKRTEGAVSKPASGDVFAKAGEPCGTIAGIRCEGTAFCDYTDKNVTGLDTRGTCRQRPTSCAAPAKEVAPVCGKDDQPYPSACHANMAGADVVPAASAHCLAKVQPAGR